MRIHMHIYSVTISVHNEFTSECMYTYLFHAYIYIYIYIYIYLYVCTIHINTHSIAYLHTCRAFTYLRQAKGTRCVCLCLCMCSYMYSHTFIHAYIHTIIHTYMHVCPVTMSVIHTYNHTYIHACVSGDYVSLYLCIFSYIYIHRFLTCTNIKHAYAACLIYLLPFS